ncbi:unnamed protein product [Caretta caretta]
MAYSVAHAQNPPAGPSRPFFTSSTRRRRIDSGETSRAQSPGVRLPSPLRMRNALRSGRRRKWEARARAKTHVGGAAGAPPPASLPLRLRSSVLPRRPDGTGSGPEEPPRCIVGLWRIAGSAPL